MKVVHLTRFSPLGRDGLTDEFQTELKVSRYKESFAYLFHGRVSSLRGHVSLIATAARRPSKMPLIAAEPGMVPRPRLRGGHFAESLLQLAY